MEPVHKGLGILSVVIASTVVAINLLGIDANSQSIVTDGEAKTESSETTVKSGEAKTALTALTEVSDTGTNVKKAPPGLYFESSSSPVENEASKREVEEPKDVAVSTEVIVKETEAPKDTAVLTEEASKEVPPEAQKKFIPLEPQQESTVPVVMDENGEPQAIFPDIPDEGESLGWANAEAQKELLEKQEPSLNIVPSMPPQWMKKKPMRVPQSVGNMQPTQQPNAQYYQPINQMPMMPYPYMMPNSGNGMPYYQYMPRIMYVPVYQYRQSADVVNQAPKVQASSRAEAAATPKQKTAE